MFGKLDKNNTTTARSQSIYLVSREKLFQLFKFGSKPRCSTEIYVVIIIIIIAMVVVIVIVAGGGAGTAAIVVVAV